MSARKARGPLSAKELRELHVLLGPSWPRAEGFVTGIISLPTTIMPGDWVPMVVEGAEPSERLTSLILRLYGEILDELNEGQEARPFDDLADEELKDWCKGYLAACRMDPVWRNDEVRYLALFPCGVLAGEFDLVGQEAADGTIIEDPTSHLQMYRDQLPFLVYELYFYWLAWRRGELDAPVKVGRNEPCPCGSGVKYKRCCGKTMSQSE